MCNFNIAFWSRGAWEQGYLHIIYTSPSFMPNTCASWLETVWSNFIGPVPKNVVRINEIARLLIIT